MSVQLDVGHAVVAYTAGKMKRNRIKTLAGDRVTVEMSPYDLEKGRLIFRHKDDRAGTAKRSPQRYQFRRAIIPMADRRITFFVLHQKAAFHKGLLATVFAFGACA